MNSPFHPQECRAARIESQRQLSRDPENFYWQVIFAESCLCDGLTHDDPVSLRLAVDRFKDLSARKPEDAEASIGYADALRTLYPAADITLAALERALDLVSKENSDLKGYLAANLATLRIARQECLRAERPIDPLDMCTSHPESADVVTFLAVGGRNLPTRQQAERLRWAGKLPEAIACYRLLLEGLQGESNEAERKAVQARLKSTEELRLLHGL